ncbi:MAG: hypothetical protein KBF78_11900 [Fuscovulum sp.]|nr:hypothetical protein [Fuscovulum sp.]
MAGFLAAIIADDLTGALDSAAPFACRGLKVLAATSLAGLPQALAQAPQVLAVNLGSREIPQAEAVARTGAAARAILAAAPPGLLWLKKIDSRLKGHVGAELAALAGVLHPAAILACPAVPDQGRTVRDGRLVGTGVTEPIAVADRLGALPGTLTVADAASDGDLDRAVAAAPGALFVGARGLAAALARLLCPDAAAVAPPALPAPMSFVIGSRDPITLAQVDALRRAGGPAWIAAPDGAAPAARAPALLQAVAAPDSPPTDGATVARRLAQGALPLLAANSGSLVVTGGETAAALLKAADIAVLHILGEAQPGLPACRAADRPDAPVLVTKSGGFGAPDSLLRLWRAAQPPRDLQ